MNSSYCLTLGCVFIAAGLAHAQSESASEEVKKKAIAEAHRYMAEVISTKDYQDKLPFSLFLEKVTKQVSTDSKFTIRLDRDAFGKDANKILKSEISLPPVPAKMNALLAVRLAIAQAAGDKHEIQFAAFPGELVITTRDRSMYTMTYEIGDLLKHTRRIHQIAVEDAKRFEGQKPEFGGGSMFADFDLKADPAKPDQWLVRQLMAHTLDLAGWHTRTPASTIRILNGMKIVVHAPPFIHDAIQMTLSMMRRHIDLAVVMTARLYELDRAEYDAHFAASFVDPKDKSASKLVATVTEAQWKRFQAMKPILHGTDDKLVPSERSEFQSMQNAYQYQAKPGDNAPATAFESMSFTVLPRISPDRRCLRLEFAHDVAQLVKLTKGTMVDQKTGKDTPVDLPNIRKSSRSQMIEIHDGQPVLLAVDYMPKDKVWLVLAEPRIYMEEEEEMIRKAANKRMPFADEPPPPPEVPLEPVKEPTPKAPVDAPNSDEVRQILHAVVESVLTDRDLKSTRDFYGTPKEAKFVLDNGHIRWPKDFDPKIAGHMRVEQPGEQCRFQVQNRLMGIRLEQFDWDAKKAVKEFSLEVVISNVGGQANGAVIGGCIVTYSARREGKRWVVQMDSILDP